MIASKNNQEPVFHYFCEGGPVVAAPADIAFCKAVQGLAKLSVLSKQGDPNALRGFHLLACKIVEELNEELFGYSASVLKWPILLPQDRKARKAVTKHANEMRIGSVKAGGKGAGEKLAETSNKGFAVKNLCRVSEARSMLKSNCYDGSYDHEMVGANGHFTGWGATEEYMEVVFSGETEIEHTNMSLLLEIRDLPDYCPETRKEWVRVIAEVLKAHPHMVSETIKARRKTKRPATSKARAKTKCRGYDSEVKKALTNGLKNVTAVPEKLGDYIGD
jgi:hypothetical protein